MDDYSSNEKVKHEKQRRKKKYYVYTFLVSMYIYP